MDPCKPQRAAACSRQVRVIEDCRWHVPGGLCHGQHRRHSGCAHRNRPMHVHKNLSPTRKYYDDASIAPGRAWLTLRHKPRFESGGSEYDLMRTMVTPPRVPAWGQQQHTRTSRQTRFQDPASLTRRVQWPAHVGFGPARQHTNSQPRMCVPGRTAALLQRRAGLSHSMSRREKYQTRSTCRRDPAFAHGDSEGAWGMRT